MKCAHLGRQQIMAMTKKTRHPRFFDREKFLVGTTAGMSKKRPLDVSSDRIVIFIDYREHDVKTSTGQVLEQTADVVKMLQSVSVVRSDIPVINASLKVGDVMIVRLTPAEEPLVEVPMPNDPTADVDMELVFLDSAIRLNGKAARVELQQHMEVLKVCERKTVNDAIASIQSKGDAPAVSRWKEQKWRLQGFCDATGAKAALIHERYYQDCISGKTNGRMTDVALFTAITHTQTGDGWELYTTNSVAQTAVLIRILARYCDEHGVTATGYYRVGSGELATGVDMKKSNNFTRAGWWETCLRAVPNMSQPRAQAIVNVYPSVGSLVDAYRACNDDIQAAELLKNIELPTAKKSKTGKVARLGPALSAQVHKLIRDEPDVPVAVLSDEGTSDSF